jgi:hypothetical protein
MHRPPGGGVSTFMASSTFEVSMTKIGSQVAPKIGHSKSEKGSPLPGQALMTCAFSGVSDGSRTRDIQDHNLAL